jgi:hypothetical protein
VNTPLIDNSILAVACIIAILMVRFDKQRKTGAIASFFLLFSPLVIFINMWGHTVAVSIVNYQRYVAGNFRYTFNLYGLLLFGVVFIVVSGMNIAAARKRIKGDIQQHTSILWINLFTATLFLPLAYFNPISLLPVIASITSTVALLSMKRTKIPSIPNTDQQIIWEKKTEKVDSL